jgi:hypothetical protein
MIVNFYKTKAGKLPGTSYKEVFKQARVVFNQIKRRTKRKPYIRSAYFDKQKVFFDFFWTHLHHKPPRERYNRLIFFKAAVELIRHSRNRPDSVVNRHKPSEMLHRFGGITKEGIEFYVQIKEHKIRKSKQLMSMFPA